MGTVRRLAREVRILGNLPPMRVLALGAVVVLSSCTSTVADSSVSTGPLSPATSAPVVAHTPRVSVASAWPAPNNKLTPGTVAALCPKARDVSAALKAKVRALYHITGPVGEYDHRMPKFLCGADESACPTRPDYTCAAALDNIWPQPPDDLTTAACAGKTGCVINRKDQLETRVYSLLRAGRMTTPQAVAVFAAPADWRHEWCVYVHRVGDGVDCRGV